MSRSTRLTITTKKLNSPRIKAFCQCPRTGDENECIVPYAHEHNAEGAHAEAAREMFRSMTGYKGELHTITEALPRATGHNYVHTVSEWHPNESERCQ